MPRSRNPNPNQSQMGNLFTNQPAKKANLPYVGNAKLSGHPANAEHQTKHHTNTSSIGIGVGIGIGPIPIPCRSQKDN